MSWGCVHDPPGHRIPREPRLHRGTAAATNGGTLIDLYLEKRIDGWHVLVLTPLGHRLHGPFSSRKQAGKWRWHMKKELERG